MPGRQRRRPRGDPALDRARAGPGGAGAVPRHQARHRPAGRERLLLRLRPRAALHPRGPHGPREEDAGDRPRRAELRPPGDQRRRREGRARARAVQARADRPQGRRRRHRGRRRRGRRRAADHVRQPRRPHRRPGLDRPVPRPAPAAHQHHPGVLPHPERRRLLAGQREEPAAAAHLRHRVGEQGRPQGLPGAAGRGRAPRPPAARRRAGPVQLPRRDRLRPGRVPPQGRRDQAGDGGLRPPPAHRGGLRLRRHPAHHQGARLRDCPATCRTTRTPCSRRWSWRTRSTTSRP